MFCPYCGNSCADTHKFCYICGKELPVLPAAAHVPEDSITEEPVPAVLPPKETPETTAEETVAPDEIPAEPPAEAPADTSEPSPVETAVPTSQPKKGRLWPPVLALCIMICLGLTAFYFGGGLAADASCFTVENGVLYFDYAGYTGSNELTIPATVDGMPVTAISDGCFQNCDRLTTIILPESVTFIGENAFAGCDSLRGIYIPNGVQSIGSNALAECPALEAVSFPSSISAIGDGCLDHNESLQYIFYDGTYARWQELYNGTFRSGVELHTSDGTYYATP